MTEEREQSLFSPIEGIYQGNLRLWIWTLIRRKTDTNDDQAKVGITWSVARNFFNGLIDEVRFCPDQSEIA